MLKELSVTRGCLGCRSSFHSVLADFQLEARI